jgi:AraC-like DNA-binding protein
MVSDLMVKYETEQKENLLKEQDIALITKEKHLQMQYVIITIFIVACVFLYVHIRKKNKRYLQIVRQNLYFVEQEKILRKTLAGISDDKPDEEKTSENTSAKYATSALTDKKSADLYLKIHCFMTDNKLYKDNSLTKERLAELLDTNRSYLSQVINKHTGLSFTHYINRLRIEEVRRILSDPEDDTPLKAIASDTGFNSLSTFYSVFQSIVGMPPSAYRNEVKKLRS